MIRHKLFICFLLLFLEIAFVVQAFPAENVQIPFQVLAADNSLKADIAIKLGEEFIHIPRACELNTVLEALEMAIYIEKMGNYDQSPLKYYQLAAALADRPIYQEFLEAAQLRLYCQ